MNGLDEREIEEFSARGSLRLPGGFVLNAGKELFLLDWEIPDDEEEGIVADQEYTLPVPDTSELFTRSPCVQEPTPSTAQIDVHTCVYKGDLEALAECVSEKNWERQVNKLDHRGNSPLMLAIKLYSSSKTYQEIVKLLVENSADIHLKDKSGWSPMDEAVAQKNRELVRVLFDSMYYKKVRDWELHKSRAREILEFLPNFYLEIKWEFDSKVIPFISRIAPNDTCKLWKAGKNLRLDSTIVGWRKLRSKRRNMSFLFRSESENNIVLVNHSKRCLVNPLEEVDEEEKSAVIGDMISSDPVQGDLSLMSYNIEPCATWRNKPVYQKIGSWKTQKYKVKFKAMMKYKKKGTTCIPLTETEYFGKECSGQTVHDLGTSTAIKNDESKNLVKQAKAHIWITYDFPFTLKDFLPLLKLMTASNPSIMKLYEFLSSENLMSILPHNSFPVKVDIPLTMSIRGIVSFQKFQMLGEGNTELMELPNYEFQPRKLAQKTLSCPKKRLFLANLIV